MKAAFPLLVLLLPAIRAWQEDCFINGTASWEEEYGYRTVQCNNLENGQLQVTKAMTLPNLTDVECPDPSQCIAGPDQVPFACNKTVYGDDGEASTVVCRCDIGKGKLRCAPPDRPPSSNRCYSGSWFACYAGNQVDCEMKNNRQCSCDSATGLPRMVCQDPPFAYSDTSMNPSSVLLTPLPNEPCEGNQADCTVFEVQCPSEPKNTVELWVKEPPAATPIIGTVLLASGGGGNDFYGSNAVLDGLHQEGFRTVERRWLGAENWPNVSGWLGGSNGLASVSCRMDAVMNYVLGQYDTTTSPVCATGSSGGALELELAVFFHRYAAQHFPLIVNTGGGLYNLVNGCYPHVWDTECSNLVTNYGLNCAGVSQDVAIRCGLPRYLSMPFGDPTFGICPRTNDTAEFPSPAEEADLISNDFETGPNLLLPDPDMKMVFMIGGNDCSGPSVHGLKMYEQVSSLQPLQVNLTVIDGAPHGVHSHPNGTDALVEIFRNHCVP